MDGFIKPQSPVFVRARREVGDPRFKWWAQKTGEIKWRRVFQLRVQDGAAQAQFRIGDYVWATMDGLSAIRGDE